MSSEETKKPQYFSNGDFEKVAADIISSPRRSKLVPETLDDSLFHISDKQQEYYTKCFRHLLKSTHGSQDLTGAIFGGDSRVVSFFKRSALDIASLSKIWSLADVNEDGWLDLAEFSTAMHLVVLRVKGEVPIPDQLPVKARPPMTPPRLSQPPAQCSITPSNSNSSKLKQSPSWNPDSSITTTDGFAVQPMIKQFSDTPPLLVDSRPTAIKHSALLALKSPSGPPPIPPPRPQQRGHARSASLDLKFIALNNGRVPNASASNATLAPSGFTSFDQVTTPILTSPRSPQPTVPAPTVLAAAGEHVVVPPPIPLRTTPPESTLRVEKRPVSVTNSSTQTEARLYDEEDVRRFISGLGSQMDDLLGEEIDATDGRGLERWSKRCLALRQQNTEMEAERARLAQVRIQLEIRLQEFEERAKMMPNSSYAL